MRSSRYGNRIAQGTFTLDGRTYALATNNQPGGIPCHLHGGNSGFDKVLWSAEPLVLNGVAGLKLHYLSKDGEEGYPGNLDVTVHYWLGNDNSLRIEYVATTDKPKHFTPVNAGLIPTGQIRSVSGTPFDFTTAHPIGARVDSDDGQLTFGGGYDHNWVLDNQSGKLALAAVVTESTSGRTMEVWTEEPGLQFYGGNFLDGSLIGKSGRPYRYRNGFCLET